MRISIAAIVLAGVAAVGAWGATIAAQGSSINDGIYTADQAKRGAPVYNSACGSCHGSALEGGEMAPPLTGAEFDANWNGVTVGDLFDRIRKTMPPDKPGSMSREDTADLLAYMLSINKYPTGSGELSNDVALLKQIKIEAAR